MVQFYKGSQSPRDASNSMLAQALGQGIGSGLNTYFANRSLDSVLKDKALSNAPASQKMEALRSALSPYGQKGQEILQQRMAIEQQAMQEGQQEVLSKVLSGEKVSAKEVAKLTPENQFKVMELQKKREAGKSVYESLLKAGYPDETAKIWQNQMENAPVGGQSDVIKNVNDLIRRSKSGKGLGGQEETQVETKPNISIPGADERSLPLNFPELPEPIGMTPADIVKQNEYREKTNIPIYTETVDRLNALDDEFREIKHLQELDENPDALPSGLERWNVDWDTGDLRVKALATPAAQDYVKTIARMARRAKDFFPGRVTNFDLDQFKQGFATLANDREGRRIIAQQMALGNRIAYLKDETYKAAVDHYGSGADPVLIKKYATENYRRLKTQLEEQLKEVNQQARTKVEQGIEKTQRPSLDEIWK
jgi:hypothetical protein